MKNHLTRHISFIAWLVLLNPMTTAQAQSIDECLSAGVSDALRICQSIIDNGSRNADVYWKLSSAQYQSGQADLADKTLNTALRLHPGNAKLISLKEIINTLSTEQALITRSAILNQKSMDKAALKISCLTKTGAIGISACKRRIELTDQDRDRIRERLKLLQGLQQANQLTIASVQMQQTNIDNGIASLEPDVAAETLSVERERSEAQAAQRHEREAELGASTAANSDQSGLSEPEMRAAKINEELYIYPLISFLLKAPAAYNRLTELWYQQPETVVFRVDLTSENVPNLPNILEGERVDIETPVSPEMSVELTGTAGLGIEPEGRIKKRVSDAAPTSWEWKVTPTNSGQQSLSLKVYVHVFDEPKTEPYIIQSYEDTIIVNVKALDRMKMAVSAVQPIWVFGALVIAGLVGAYSWLRRKGWRVDKETVP